MGTSSISPNNLFYISPPPSIVPRTVWGRREEERNTLACFAVTFQGSFLEKLMMLKTCNFAPACCTLVWPGAHLMHTFSLLPIKEIALRIRSSVTSLSVAPYSSADVSVFCYGRLHLQLLPRCNWICFISFSCMTLKLPPCSKYRAHFGFSCCLAKMFPKAFGEQVGRKTSPISLGRM